MNRKRKNNSLLLEQRQRNNIRNIIKEEMQMINHHMRVCDIVILKEAELRSRGIPQRVINESILGFLQQIPGGIYRYLKQYLGAMLLQKIGLNTESVLGYALKNVIENLELGDITKYFGGDCEPVVNLILKSMEEGLAEKGMDYIVTAIFGRKLDGIFSGSAREMITQQLEMVTNEMRAPIESAICNLDFTGLMTGLKNIFGRLTGGTGPEASPTA